MSVLNIFRMELVFFEQILARFFSKTYLEVLDPDKNTVSSVTLISSFHFGEK